MQEGGFELKTTSGFSILRPSNPYAGGRIRTSELTKRTALEAVAFDHFATPALILRLIDNIKSFRIKPKISQQLLCL